MAFVDSFFARQSSEPAQATMNSSTMGYTGAFVEEDVTVAARKLVSLDPVRRRYIESLKHAGLLNGDEGRRHQAKDLYAYPNITALAQVAKKRETFHEIMGSPNTGPNQAPVPPSPLSTTSVGLDSPQVGSESQSPQGSLQELPTMDVPGEQFSLPPPERCTDPERTDLLWNLAGQGSPSMKPFDMSNEVDGDQKPRVYLLQSQRLADRAFQTIFKPLDEEGFERRGIEVGTGALREEAAYVIDRIAGGQAHVPVTARASFEDYEKGSRKKGSVQLFVEESCGPVENFGMPLDLDAACKVIGMDEAQAIACFDIRIFNTDRHPGNLLLAGQRPYKVVCIDHGCALPAWWALEFAQFDAWLGWPHVKEPATPATCELVKEVVRTLPNVLKDLNKLGLPKQAAWTLRICTAMLEHGVLKHGLSLQSIAQLMVRSDPSQPSWLERQVEDACEAAKEFAEFVPEGKYGDPVFYIEPELMKQFEMWDDANVSKHMRQFEHDFFDHLRKVFAGDRMMKDAEAMRGVM